MGIYDYLKSGMKESGRLASQVILGPASKPLLDVYAKLRDASAPAPKRPPVTAAQNAAAMAPSPKIQALGKANPINQAFSNANFPPVSQPVPISVPKQVQEPIRPQVQQPIINQPAPVVPQSQVQQQQSGLPKADASGITTFADGSQLDAQGNVVQKQQEKQQEKPVDIAQPVATQAPEAPSQASLDYKASLVSSPEETNIQSQLDAIKAQQGNVTSAAQAAINKIKNDPNVLLPLAVGQQAAIERSHALQSSILANQAQTLEEQLQRLQQSRLAKAEQAKFALSQEQSAAQRAAEQAKPIEIGGSLVRFNPVTGKSEVVYKAPVAQKAEEGFTLGEGQRRYDAQGNLLAEGAPKKETQNVGGFIYEKQQDGTWKEVAGQGPAGKAPTPEQFKVAGFASRIQQSESSFQNPQLLAEMTNVYGRIPGVPERLKSENRKLYEQAEQNFINAVLRRESGAAIAPSEFANARSQYIPQPGDTPAVVNQKLENRRIVLEGLKNEAARAPVIESGIKTSVDDYLDTVLGKNKEQQSSSKGTVSVSIPASARLASVNNNPGNLRFAGQPGAVQGQGGFAKFPSPQAGYEALKRQIQLDASRGHTVQSFVSKYAPPSENKTSQYIQQIAAATGTNPGTPIRSIPLELLAREMAKKESSTKIS